MDKKTITSNTLVIHRTEGSNIDIRLDYIAVRNAAMTLRAVNHKLRQQFIKLLEENKRMNVTDLYVKLRLEQSVASQHLAILRRANIVVTEREGKNIHYALNHARIVEIARFVNELVHSEEIYDAATIPVPPRFPNVKPKEKPEEKPIANPEPNIKEKQKKDREQSSEEAT